MGKKRGKHLTIFIISVVILLSVPMDTVQRAFERMRVVLFDLHDPLFLWQWDPGVVIFGLLYVLCIVVMVISLIRLLTAKGSRASTPSGQRIKPPERTSRSPKKRQPHEEEAIGCEHLTGTDKYLEQIDGFLKTGLIDRAEYKVLRERYSQMDIPDDYH